MMFISVDLPEPDGPMMATYSFGWTSTESPRRAWTCSTPIWYVFHTSAMWMIGSPSERGEAAGSIAGGMGERDSWFGRPACRALRARGTAPLAVLLFFHPNGVVGL